MKRFRNASSHLTTITQHAYFYLFSAMALVPVPVLANVKVSLAGHTIGLFHVLFMFLSLLFLWASRGSGADQKGSLFLWLLFPAAIVFSCFFSLNKATAFQASLRFLFQGVVIGFFVSKVGNREEWPPLFTKMVGVVCVAAIIGILQTYYGRDFIYYRLYFYGYAEALTNPAMIRAVGVPGTIGHPVPYALFLSMFVPHALLMKVPLAKKTVAVLLLLAALLFCESRAAMLSALLGTIVALQLNSYHKVKNRFLFILLLSAMAVAAYAILRFYYGGHYMRGLEIESHRMSAYQTAWKIFLDHPFFGVGMGHYQFIRLDYAVKGLSLGELTPDSQYLLLLTETGAVGLLSLLLVGLFVVRHVIQKVRSDSLPPYEIACFSALVGTACALMFVDGLNWVPIQFTFWSFVGSCLSRRS